jgi:glyoxylase-like metal-dependent hydrolase (beta-lactamase superfamily II)
MDPARLLKSASRVFGSNIEEFWGAFKPVPAGNLSILNGGEEITIGERQFETLYTPGHAIHHVSYFEMDSKVAFVGDAAGVRITDSYVYPATPPPDVDLAQLNESESHRKPPTTALVYDSFRFGGQCQMAYD